MRVYERHGPLLRAVSEAGASNPQIAARGAELRRRFNQLVAASLARLPGLGENPPADVAESARALNLLNEAYLRDAFGRGAADLPRGRHRDSDRDLVRVPRPAGTSRRGHLMPVEPSPEQLAEMQAIAGGPEDGPLVMLNLNRYRDPAAYGALWGGRSARPGAGRGPSPLARIGRTGTVIGEGEERFDDVIAVWYPSATAFLQLVADPETLEARDDRLEGLERAAILRCEAEAEPVLRGLAA